MGESLHQPKTFAAGIIDTETKRLFLLAEDALITQFRSTSIKIGESFDKLFSDQLKDISSETGRITVILHAGRMRAVKEDDDYLKLLAGILLNARNDIAAATELLRHGYRLQPAIVLRTALESLTSVAYLVINPEETERFRTGKLESNNTIAAAKELVPPFGELYGRFSDFTHISSIRHEFEPIREFDDPLDPSAIVNISMIKTVVYLMAIIVELAFFNEYPEHRFWKSSDGNQITFDAGDAAQQFFNEFLKKFGDEYLDRLQNPSGD